MTISEFLSLPLPCFFPIILEEKISLVSLEIMFIKGLTQLGTESLEASKHYVVQTVQGEIVAKFLHNESNRNIGIKEEKNKEKN